MALFAAVDTNRMNLAPPNNQQLIPQSQGFVSRCDNPVAEELILAELFRALRRHRVLILAWTAGCLLLAVFYIAIKSSRYEATAQIEVSPAGTNALGLNDLAGKALSPSDPTIQLQSAVQILQSNAIALEVMKQLRMASRKDFAGSWLQPESRTMNEIPPKARDRLIERFEKNMKVEIVPKTDILRVRFRAKDPRLASDAVNAIVSSYTERNFRSSYNSAVQVSDWLSKQMDDLRAKAEDSQRKLSALQQTTGLIGEDETDNIVTEKLKQLDEQLTTAESDRIVKEARYRIAQSGNPELIATTVPDPTLQVLRSQQAELRVQYAQLNTKFGKGYPKLAELASQSIQLQDAIDAELKNLSSRYHNDYLAAANTESMLHERFEQQKQRAFALNASAAQYGILKHEVESTQDLYETLQLKLKQAGIAAGLASANVGVVDLGQVPSEPIEPRPTLDLLIGLGCGVALGVLSAVGLEALDNTVRSSEELEAVSALPVLAAIPYLGEIGFPWWKKLRASRSTSHALWMSCEQPRSSTSESFRSLRSSLLLGNAGPVAKTIMVTSPACSEGKSFTAMNYATVLAQQGAKVLLVDADLRHPSLHEVLGVARAPGLCGLLDHSCAEADALLRSEAVPDLTILLAGEAPEYPAELLASNQLRERVEQWRQQYDFVVIDTPPVCLVTDAVVLSALADAVLLVARSGRTTRHALRRARDLLQRANARIAGAVLNGVDSQYQDSYYFRQYGCFGRNPTTTYYDRTIQ